MVRHHFFSRFDKSSILPSSLLLRFLVFRSAAVLSCSFFVSSLTCRDNFFGLFKQYWWSSINLDESTETCNSGWHEELKSIDDTCSTLCPTDWVNFLFIASFRLVADANEKKLAHYPFWLVFFPTARKNHLDENVPNRPQHHCQVSTTYYFLPPSDLVEQPNCHVS